MLAEIEERERTEWRDMEEEEKVKRRRAYWALQLEEKEREMVVQTLREDQERAREAAAAEALASASTGGPRGAAMRARAPSGGSHDQLVGRGAPLGYHADGRPTEAQRILGELERIKTFGKDGEAVRLIAYAHTPSSLPDATHSTTSDRRPVPAPRPSRRRRIARGIAGGRRGCDRSGPAAAHRLERHARRGWCHGRRSQCRDERREPQEPQVLLAMATGEHRAE